ncbi:MAG: hypothetical protein M3410_14860 [Acidobacteriota bacterium]|nr:hypothetical protein [Acidobacteriota bacterium]
MARVCFDKLEANRAAFYSTYKAGYNPYALAHLSFSEMWIVRPQGVAANAEVGHVTMIISSGDDTNDGP